MPFSIGLAILLNFTTDLDSMTWTTYTYTWFGATPGIRDGPVMQPYYWKSRISDDYLRDLASQAIPFSR